MRQRQRDSLLGLPLEWTQHILTVSMTPGGQKVQCIFNGFSVHVHEIFNPVLLYGVVETPELYIYDTAELKQFFIMTSGSFKQKIKFIRELHILGNTFESVVSINPWADPKV